jgi:putative phage-type endonuclease
MKQGSPEWFAARLGIVTASRIVDVMAQTRSGPAAARSNYMAQLLCERLTGRAEDSFTSAAMQRGTELEPLARSAYEADRGLFVTECGLVKHPVISGLGASPDGLVGEDGLIEIKCPNTATHIETLRSKKPATKYVWQMTAQMACTNRDWCDFVSFDDRLPEHLQMIVIRVDRDEKREKEMLTAVEQFLDELNSMYLELAA